MKIIALVVTVAVAVIVLTAVTSAPASQEDAVTRLTKRVTTLEKKVKTLNSDLNLVAGVLVGCAMGKTVSANQYSGYTGTQATAIDVTHTGDPPTSFLLAADSDPTCINLINSTPTVRALLAQGRRR